MKGSKHKWKKFTNRKHHKPTATEIFFGSEGGTISCRKWFETAKMTFHSLVKLIATLENRIILLAYESILRNMASQERFHKCKCGWCYRCGSRIFPKEGGGWGWGQVMWPKVADILK